MAGEDKIQTTALSFHNMHEHGTLFVNLLRARRQSFIVRNKWELPEAGGLEYDQYDNPSSRWVAVHVGDEVLAGIRLTPTTARCGMYSYMIRDAQIGLVTSIPSNLLYFDAPVEADIWESSRIFVSQSVPARLRTLVQAKLMTGLIEAARANGAKQMLGLVPAVWPRWIRRLDLRAEPAGPVLQTENWPTQVAMMHLSAPVRPRNAIAAPDIAAPPDPVGGTGISPGIIQRARLRKYRPSIRAAE